MMNIKQLEQANIDNLTNLWKLLGYEKRPLNSHLTLNYSQSWPYRVWFNWHNEPSVADWVAAGKLTGAMPNAKFPTWHQVDINEMEQNGFATSFAQTAMVLHLHNEIERIPTELVFKEVTSQAETAVWTEIASQSFGYTVPPEVMQKVVGTPELTLILAYLDDEPMATTLLFTNSDVVGVHLVGVPLAFRRRGFARKIMQYALQTIEQSGVAYATLQASALGEPLYESLGFTKQFTITSFVKAE